MNSNEQIPKRHGAIQFSGLLLWRFGLLLAASTGIYRTLKLIFEHVDFPIQLEIGLGLMIAGAIFFFASLIVERTHEARAEGDLQRDIS